MPKVEIPPIGLGTWELKDPDTTPSIIAKAIEIGYRHIDTAQAYFNERLVGQGVNQSGIDRDELFIATKVVQVFLKPDDLKNNAAKSVAKLDVEYVDLLYIHWPAETYEPESSITALNEVMDEGLTKHIAISNFTPPLLEEAVEISKHPLIANQVEMHPLLRQVDMLQCVKKHDMYLVAYSPLGQGMILDVPEVQEVAQRHGITEAQVSLAWLLSKENVVTIPKAKSEEHQRENLEVLDIKLKPEDIALIDSIKDEVRLIEPHFAPDW